MNILKVLFVILFFVVTLFTIKLHPGIHQPMLIEDENFELVRISNTIPTENIPMTSAKNPTENQQKYIQQIKQPVTQKVQITQTSPQKINQQIELPKRQEKVVQVVQPPKTIHKTNSPANEKTQIEILQDLLNTDIEDTKKLEENAKKLAQTMQNPPRQVQKPVQKQVSTHKNPYMTEQEEIIAWNKWRSNLQNQIMRDSNIDYAPLGTLFTFTFVVDKFGNVSNIKVECSNPNFMDIARNNVKPAISRLQRKPILNFPMGTQRTTTVVVGSFLIGTQERFSSPDDYADFERVVH